MAKCRWCGLEELEWVSETIAVPNCCEYGMMLYDGVPIEEIERLYQAREDPSTEWKPNIDAGEIPF